MTKKTMRVPPSPTPSTNETCCELGGFAQQTTDSLNETLILIYGRGRQRKISVEEARALGKIKDRSLLIDNRG